MWVHDTDTFSPARLLHFVDLRRPELRGAASRGGPPAEPEGENANGGTGRQIPLWAAIWPIDRSEDL